MKKKGGDMGNLSFSKSLGAKIFAVLKTAARLDELKKEAGKCSLDGPKTGIKTEGGKAILSGGTSSREEIAAIASPYAKFRLAAASLALALILLAPASASAGDGVRVMTWNLYQGTNFQELIAAKSPSEFVDAVTTTYQNILATKPAERAAASAREIAKNRPDVVGLQG